MQRPRRTLAIGTAGVLAAAVGVLDHATGREWHITPLYLLPLSFAVWFAGRRWGIAFSVFIAGIWLAAAELAVGPAYSHPAIPYWNASMFLVIFVMVTQVLSRLHEITATLEQRVEVRTTRLREEMTKRSQAELGLLRAERLAVVGSMAAQMAHEVRNPLCSISLNMELLSQELQTLTASDSSTPAEAEFLMAQIEKEFGRIAKVVRDYLAFARLPKVMPRSRLLHAFLDQKLSLVAPELVAAGVKLVKIYDPTITRMKIDPARMWQVLLNLIRNACDAMPQGGELKILTRREGDHLSLTVSDTGCGIGSEDIGKLFTPFFTTKAQGNGLGLALSHQIVAEHGGRLECASAPGAGATFTLSFPLPSTSRRALTSRLEFPIPQPPQSHEFDLARSAP